MLSLCRWVQTLFLIMVAQWPRGSCLWPCLRKLWLVLMAQERCILMVLFRIFLCLSWWTRAAHTLTHIADKLQGVQQLSGSIQVQVANGGIMHCSTHFPAAVWMIQNCSFTSDLRILPLQHFDDPGNGLARVLQPDEGPLEVEVDVNSV